MDPQSTENSANTADDGTPITLAGAELGVTRTDLDRQLLLAQEEDARRRDRLRHQARAAYRAMEGWAGVRDEADWVRAPRRRTSSTSPAAT